jgi:hypothetical protein
VHAGFDETDPTTDHEIVRRAQQLSEQLQKSPAPREPSPEAAAKLEADFERQVEHFATLEAQLGQARAMIQALQTDRAFFSSQPANETL